MFQYKQSRQYNIKKDKADCKAKQKTFEREQSISYIE